MSEWHARFQSHYRVGSADECWPWLSSTSAAGYGRFLLDGKARIASRVAYMMAFGDPGQTHVLHRCDNPACVNPSHLFLGTHKDNMGDRNKKGRSRGGSL